MSPGGSGAARQQEARTGLVRNPSLPYILPFAVFMLLLAGQKYVAALGSMDFPFRVLVLSAVIWWASRSVLSFRVVNWAGTVAVGIAVFALWVGPDLLFPGYRNHWLFQNAVLGKIGSSIDAGLLADPMVLSFRAIRAIVLVPILEELFWRAWLMRWLISTDFEKVPLGTYAAGAFWITAVLFASEHGPYWDVGLVAGVIYNWWMIRTKSLGDCILMHAVTNACLSLYVILAGRWEYWL
jgi:uncharacterized protein